MSGTSLSGTRFTTLTGLLSTSGLLLGLSFTGCEGPKRPAAPQAEQAAPAEQPAEAPAPEPKQNLLQRKTDQVVEKRQAMADNPQLVEVENKVNAADPLTASLQGYIAISSRANVLNFQHQVNLMKAAEDRNPTYQEILDLIKQTRMEFNALPVYQTYAYDEQNGVFTILEDPAIKADFQKQ